MGITLCTCAREFEEQHEKNEAILCYVTFEFHLWKNIFFINVYFAKVYRDTHVTISVECNISRRSENENVYVYSHVI